MLQDNRLRLLLIAGSILLIVVALAFGGLLNIFTFKHICLESLSSSYQVAALSTKRNIEYSVRYGKMLNNFTGLEDVLADVKENIQELENVQVVLPDGQILCDLNGPVKQQKLASELVATVNFNTKIEDLRYQARLFNGGYYLFLPLCDKYNNWIGTLVLSAKDQVIMEAVATRVWTVLQSTVVVAILSLNFMVFVLFALPILNGQGKVHKKRLVFVVVTIFALAQFFFSLMNIDLFKKAYVEMAKQSMSILTHSVQEDINKVVLKGVPYTRLNGLENYFEQIIAGSPEVERIAILNGEGAALYRAGNAAAWVGDDSQRHYFQPLIYDKNGAGATLHAWLSMSYIEDKIKTILLDAGAVAILFLFCMVEMVTLLPYLRHFTHEAAAKAALVSTELRLIYAGRLAVFNFFLAADFLLTLTAWQLRTPLMLAVATVAMAAGAKIIWIGLQAQKNRLSSLGSMMAWNQWRAGIAGGSVCGCLSGLLLVERADSLLVWLIALALLVLAAVLFLRQSLQANREQNASGCAEQQEQGQEKSWQDSLLAVAFLAPAAIGWSSLFAIKVGYIWFAVLLLTVVAGNFVYSQAKDGD